MLLTISCHLGFRCENDLDSVLASLIDRFVLMVDLASHYGISVRCIRSPDTADREVLELAGVNWFIFHCLHPDFMEGHVRWIG